MMSAEDDQKLRRRAGNDRYRQGKGKEPQQQARVAASAAKYRAGQGRTEENRAKVAASAAKTSALMMSAEDDQKLRRRARNDRYRQGKGKEPQQQARVAASAAKYRAGQGRTEENRAKVAASAAKTSALMMNAEDDQKLRRRARNDRYRQGKGKEPQQQARVAASAAKYRAGQGRTEKNKKKIKASQEAYMNKLRKSEDYSVKRKVSNTKYRGGDEGQTKRKSAKAQYFKKRAQGQRTDEIVGKVQEGLLRNIPDSEDECRDETEDAPMAPDQAATLARHYAAVYERFQVLFLSEMEKRTDRLASKCTNALQIVASSPDDPPRKTLLEPCIHRSTAMPYFYQTYTFPLCDMPPRNIPIDEGGQGIIHLHVKDDSEEPAEKMDKDEQPVEKMEGEGDFIR